MIRATLRSAQVFNGVIARSASNVPQLHKTTTCSLVPRVGSTLLQSKMYGSYSGNFSLPALPTDQVKKLTNDMKTKAEIAAKRPLPEYNPVLFSQQISIFPGVLEETEYHVKVQTGVSEYIQVRFAEELYIDKGLETYVWFNGCLDHRTREDPIRPYQPLIGGFTDVLLPTPDIIYKTKELKKEVEKATNKEFPQFNAVLYRSQVVAGVNHLVKVQTGPESDDYLHLMFYEGPEPEPVSSTYQYPKNKEAPLVPFS